MVAGVNCWYPASDCAKVQHVAVVVYHVTIVAIGHGLLKEILAYGDRLRSTHCQGVPLFETMLELLNELSKKPCPF